MIENKILFVDDEEYLLSSIERQLRNQFNIQTCSSAAEALDCIKKNNYSVIVADYHMPGMNGVEFLAKTKVIAPRTVRILFTGKADLNVAISAVNEGHVFKFLSKPYSTEKLISVLRQALGHYKMFVQAAQNEFMALHDTLTGLPNRVYLLQKLTDALAMGKRTKTQVGVLFLDLDGFKAVNDQFGHETGDKLLKMAAQIFKGSIRETDSVGRFGGDEFIVILQSLNVGREAGISAQRIIDSFSDAIEIDTNKCRIGTSIGISIFPSDAHVPDELIKNADTAMYHSKNLGGSQYTFFSKIRDMVQKEKDK